MSQRLSRNQQTYRNAIINDILCTAAIQVAEGGTVSVRRIGERLGIAPTGIYRYFPSLQALTAATGELFLAELDDLAAAASGGAEGFSRARAAVLVEWQQTRPAVWSILAGPGGPLAQLVSAALAAYAEQ